MAGCPVTAKPATVSVTVARAMGRRERRAPIRKSGDLLHRAVFRRRPHTAAATGATTPGRTHDRCRRRVPAPFPFSFCTLRAPLDCPCCLSSHAADADHILRSHRRARRPHRRSAGTSGRRRHGRCHRPHERAARRRTSRRAGRFTFASRQTARYDVTASAPGLLGEARGVAVGGGVRRQRRHHAARQRRYRDAAWSRPRRSTCRCRGRPTASR